ncbi:uncharacterized protein LOC144879996 [Branchiostoma floridae x Branchiostoma japonicum]
MMAHKLAMFLGLSAVLVVLMVHPADSVCCPHVRCAGGMWLRRCFCADNTMISEERPFCGKGPCDSKGCNCERGCRQSKRGVAEDALGLLELLRGEQEDTGPKESALAGRGFGDHDTDQDMKLSKQEALEMLEMLKQMEDVDIDNLPADWFTSMDTNGNGFIDPEEYDEDEAKTLQ